MISQVFKDDFNKATRHNDFFSKIIAPRIAKFERSRNAELGIKRYAVEFMTPTLKASYSEVDARDKAGIDAYIHLYNADSIAVGCIPVQLKSIFTDFRTVSVAVGDVEKLSNVRYYVTIYDKPDGNHEYVVAKSAALRQFINERQSELKGTSGYFRTNKVHSKESFFAIPVYAEESYPYIYQHLCAYSNNIFLYCEVPYTVMENKAFKKSLETFKANSLI